MEIKVTVDFSPQATATLNALALALTKTEAPDVKQDVDADEAPARVNPYATEKPKAAKKKAAPVVEEDEESVDEEDEEDFKPKASKKKAAAKAFDEDEEESDEADEEEPAPKKKAAAKVTMDDVNDACKAKAKSIGGSEGRAEVLKILTKKFKTKTVSELKPEQYGAVISAMAV